jgi:hypothetical protein
MHYTSPTRGRWILAIGAIVMAGSTILQWWQIGGGTGELSQLSGQGISDGRVFLMFLAAIASLLLVTLPFASEKPMAIDHPLVYLALFAVGLVGYLLRVVSMVQDNLLPFPPQHGLGFWLAAVGLVLVARGVFEMHEERQSRLY